MADTILQKIKAYKLLEILEKKKLKPASDLQDLIAKKEINNYFLNSILLKNNNKHAVIAEIKRASPSKGIIRQNFNPIEIAREYEKGGASCISVLTDRPSFMGSEDDLIDVKSNCNLPILRKDFIFDEYQILESKTIGADCILIILSAVDFSKAKELEHFAVSLGLEVLIEIHDRDELEIANDMQSPLIGINNRNLHTFITDTSLTKNLSQYVNQDKVIISESGLSSRNHLDELTKFGVNGFLIGETLMKSDKIAMELSKLVK